MLIFLILELGLVRFEGGKLRFLIKRTVDRRVLGLLPFVDDHAGVFGSGATARRRSCPSPTAGEIRTVPIADATTKRRSSPPIVHVGYSTRKGFLGRSSGPIRACRRPLLEEEIGPDLDVDLRAVGQGEVKDVRAGPVVAGGKGGDDDVGERDVFHAVRVGLSFIVPRNAISNSETEESREREKSSV